MGRRRKEVYNDSSDDSISQGSDNYSEIKPRRKKRMNDTDEESDHEPIKSKKNKPVNFVQAEKNQTSEKLDHDYNEEIIKDINPQDEEYSDSDSESEVRPKIDRQEDYEERPTMLHGSDPLPSEPIKNITPNPNLFKPNIQTKKPIQKTTQKPIIEKADKDFAEFTKLSKGIGLKLMMKMGYKKGEGLGVDGSGIVNPIDVKLRPRQMGLGHNDFDERTEAVKKQLNQNLGQTKEVEKTPIWKKTAQKTKKFKVKSIDELIREQEAMGISISGESSKIIDMTGKKPKELDNIAAAKNMDMITHLPELRYNLGVLTDLSYSQMMEKTRLLRIEKHKQEDSKRDSESFIAYRDNFTSQIDQYKAILNTLRECENISNSTSPHSNPNDIFIQFQPQFSQLFKYEELFWKHSLDHAICSCLSPLFKICFQFWEPLDNPDHMRDHIEQLSIHLIPKKYDNETKTIMSPYETLLYTLWIPKIRSSIINEWDIYDPDPVISLLEEWFPTSLLDDWDPEFERTPRNSIIPFWMYNNILDQLVIPKLRNAVMEWNPLESSQPTSQFNPSVHPIHIWLFPWLPILKSKLSELFLHVRQKIVSSLSNWHPSKPIAYEIIRPWLQALKPKDLDSLLSKAILPRLIQCLRVDFQVNPADQDIEPLQHILSWSQILRPALFSHLIETEFFPKWHSILELWLNDPQVNFEEITEWYLSWKTVFPPNVLEMQGVINGFRKGLDMMNYGPETVHKETPTLMKQSAQTRVSFKDIFEEVARENGLLLVSANRVITKGSVGRHIVYHLGTNLRGGIYVYLDDGVIFLEQGDKWSPISLDETIEKATRK